MNSSAGKGRLLGIDYGTVRIGLAVCDPDRVIASPLETYTRKDPAADASYISHVISQHNVVGLVIGLPLHASGEESQKSQEARGFARWLSEATKQPAVLWDERFTSALAEDAMLEARLTKKKRKARVDSVAAQMILQAYLDAGCPHEGSDAVMGGD